MVSTPAEIKEQTQYLGLMKSLFEAESQLESVRATRSALESRRSSLRDTIRKISDEIESSFSTVTEPEIQSFEPRKKPRYFDGPMLHEVTVDGLTKSAKPTTASHQETQDDLSTVVCPFELLGKCTDPDCPHMHLDR